MKNNFDRAISLGTHCYAATMLSEAGLRLKSYPFDWLFSDIRMNTACIKDEFRALLDQSLYVSHANGVGHAIYSPTYVCPLVFSHSDPRTEDGHAELTRRSRRFLEDIRIGGTYFLVVTHIDRSQKHMVADLDSVLSLLCPQHHLDVIQVDVCDPQLATPRVELIVSSPTSSTWYMKPTSQLGGTFRAEIDNNAVKSIIRHRTGLEVSAVPEPIAV